MATIFETDTTITGSASATTYDEPVFDTVVVAALTVEKLSGESNAYFDSTLDVSANHITDISGNVEVGGNAFFSILAITGAHSVEVGGDLDVSGSTPTLYHSLTVYAETTLDGTVSIAGNLSINGGVTMERGTSGPDIEVKNDVSGWDPVLAQVYFTSLSNGAVMINSNGKLVS